MIVTAPAWIEPYAVLTRLPPPRRLSPQTALALLKNNFLKLGSVIALNGNSHQTLLLGAPKNNVAGGRAYDAVIGACAEQAKATTVLTFNARDFAALGGQRYDLVVAGTIKRAFGNQAPRAACARGAVMQPGQPLISIAQKLGGLRRFFPEHPPRVP